MRRLVALVALLLLVVGAQQAALVHAISHAVGHGAAPAATQAQAAGSPDGGSATADAAYCDKCFQFAHVSGASVGAPVLLALDAVPFAAASGPALAALPAAVLHPHHRGPPATT